MKLDWTWITKDHPILPSLALVALTSIAANLLVSVSLLVAFRAISTSGEAGVFGPLDNLLLAMKEAGLEPGLIVVVAIGILVAANNLTAQIETRILRRQLMARASNLKPFSDRTDRQWQAGYISTLRPLYGTLFSLSSELPKVLVFATASLVFFASSLWIWLVLGTVIAALMMRRGFARGGRIFAKHRRLRADREAKAEALVESLVSIESNAAVLPGSNLVGILSLAIAPFVATWFTTGSLSPNDSSWIPVWLLLISSVATLVRLSSSLGLLIVRNGEYRVVDGVVQKNAR